MAESQQYVVSVRFDRFILEDACRPQGTTQQRALSAKTFVVAWGMVADGTQSFLGSTHGTSFRVLANQFLCDWDGHTAEIVLDQAVLSNFGARVLLFRIFEIEMNPRELAEDPSAVLQFLLSSGGAHGKKVSAMASATVDPGSLLKRPARDYCVKMESQFATVGRLYFNLVVEMLAAKRFNDRAIVERRLVLRIDRVVPHRLSNSNLKGRINHDNTISSNSNLSTQRASLVTNTTPSGTPLVAQRAASEVSSSNGSSLGPAASTPLAGPNALSTLRVGAEYVVKVRLSCGKVVYRTPLSICDTDGRVRWNYEITIPLPPETSTISRQSSGGAQAQDPNCTTLSNASSAPNPGTISAAQSESNISFTSSNAGWGPMSRAPSAKVVPTTSGSKLQVALLEGQQVVSAFGIDVAKLRAGKTWTEVAVPSPFTAIRYDKDGTMQTATGTVLFEWSVRSSEALRLKTDSPKESGVCGWTPKTSTAPSEAASVANTPCGDHISPPHENNTAPTAIGIRRKAPPLNIMNEGPTSFPSSRPLQENTSLEKHPFGESLCSIHAGSSRATASPRDAPIGGAPEAMTTTLTASQSASPAYRGVNGTQPPTPSTNVLWEPIGTGTSAPPPPPSAARPTGEIHLSSSAWPPAALGQTLPNVDHQSGDDMSSSRLTSSQRNNPHGKRNEDGRADMRTYDTLSDESVSLGRSALAPDSRRNITTVSTSCEWGQAVSLDERRASETPTFASDELVRQVKAQNNRINELQRQLAQLQQQQQQQQQSSRSTSVMSLATIGTETTARSSLFAGWGSSAGGYRSPSADHNRSNSEGSRRATPRRTHSLTREEVVLEAASAHSTRKFGAKRQTGLFNDSVDATQGTSTPQRGRRAHAVSPSPAPYDPMGRIAINGRATPTAPSPLPRLFQVTK